MRFIATLDHNSTAGDFHGNLVLEFKVGSDFSGSTWSPAYIKQTFQAHKSEAAVSLSFTAGGEGPAFEYNLYAGFSFSDPRIPTPQYPLLNLPVTMPGGFVPGTPGMRGGPWDYSSGDVELSRGDGLRPVGTVNFSFSLPVEFDGTSAKGVGKWSLKYSIN